MTGKTHAGAATKRPAGLTDLPESATRDISAALNGLLADVFALNQARLLQPVRLAGERTVADAEFARKLGQCSAVVLGGDRVARADAPVRRTGTAAATAGQAFSCAYRAPNRVYNAR